MIGNKLEQSIINVFQKHPTETFSINQVSKIIKKAYPHINRKSNYFLKEGILRKINIGKSYQCYLNIKSEKARLFMAANEINRLEENVAKNKNLRLAVEESIKIVDKYPVECILYLRSNIIIVFKDGDLIAQFSDEILTHTLLKDYRIQFWTTKELQERYIEDAEMQAHHIVFANTDRFLRLLSELNEKFMLKAMLQEKDEK
ncbi:MAG: hypothetical protein ACP5NV_03710 [Candidatus Woesearchaeota archaeon]